VPVGQDQRRIIIDAWVDLGFQRLEHCGHRQWLNAAHQPGDQVCPIAAEINDRPTTVEQRVGQPGQDFGALLAVTQH
jgi:hypothetical protein